MKSKYRDKAKLRYMDTDSFIKYIEIEDIYVYITKDVEQDLILQIRQTII